MSRYAYMHMAHMAEVVAPPVSRAPLASCTASAWAHSDTPSVHVVAKRSHCHASGTHSAATAAHMAAGRSVGWRRRRHAACSARVRVRVGVGVRGQGWG